VNARRGCLALHLRRSPRLAGRGRPDGTDSGGGLWIRAKPVRSGLAILDEEHEKDDQADEGDESDEEPPAALRS
jgi:hypothetical protein